MYALSWCIVNLISDTATNSKLVLLYVKPTPLVYPTFDTAVFAAMEKYGKKLANSVMEKAEAVCRNLNYTNINMEKVVGCGDAKDVICNAVQKLEADILVMGSHAYGFFKRAVMGSVSDHCAKHAKCPVVIVKHP
ncbi:hypothetical protein L6164_034766 [Bauhinia variegata]|uniref:Uncharacterized protein n=1 Tax=Bauhinia variegata TaxID=167791 RepID=A0ACB9KVY0_BAUVA|nr:hypothetical protein L6164_034766 [Bauhinia variegata]